MSEPSVSMHHVGIVVRDLDRAEAFLSGTLGLPVIDRFARTEVGKRSAFLACGPAMIELIEFTDPAAADDRIGTRVVALDHIALQVSVLEYTQRVLLGRSSDVINVAGKRSAPAEVQSVLVAEPDVAEAATARVPHDLKGEALWCSWSPANPVGKDRSGRPASLVADQIGRPFSPSRMVRMEATPGVRPVNRAND